MFGKNFSDILAIKKEKSQDNVSSFLKQGAGPLEN